MLESLKLIDRSLLLAINSYHSSFMDNIMYYISAVWIFFPLFVYWLYLFFRQYGPRKVLILGAFLGVLIALTDQSSYRIKHGVKRYRPTHNLEIREKVHIVNDYRGGQYGFFSGHAANSFGIATLLFLLYSQRSHYLRWSFFAWAALLSYSRMYLGVHYPSDILVGMLVGIFWGLVVYKLIQFTFKKYFNETISV